MACLLSVGVQVSCLADGGEELKAVVPATAEEPSEVAEAEEKQQVEPQWRRVQMRLSGSSCSACLKDLERKLKNISGIASCKIQYPGDNLYQSVPGAGWSLATLVVDQAKVSNEQVSQYLKTQGYHAFKVIDKGPATP